MAFSFLPAILPTLQFGKAGQTGSPKGRFPKDWMLGCPLPSERYGFWVSNRGVEVWPAFDYPPRNVPEVVIMAGGSEVGTTPSRQVSELLLDWGNGDRKVLEAILPLVYNELRRLARSSLRQQRPNHTLQTTALVNEAYLRLAGEKSLRVESRAHFLGIAAQLMRWILVDYERNRRAVKRGAGQTRLTLDESIPSPQRNVDVVALDEALDRLAKLDSQQSQIIELRYFGGLSIEDTSEFLGISSATVKRSWSSARAWLLREMSQKSCVHDARTVA